MARKHRTHGGGSNRKTRHGRLNFVSGKMTDATASLVRGKILSSVMCTSCQSPVF